MTATNRRLLRTLKAGLRHPRALSGVPRTAARTAEDSLVALRVTKEYGLGNGLPEVDLLDLLPGFSATVRSYTFLDGTSPPLDLAVIKALAQQLDNGTYLEIGTWRGESVLNVADTGAQCVSLSLGPGELRAIGASEDFIAQNRILSAEMSNVTYLEGNSLTFDFGPLEGRFDLIFVDGDHSYDAVRRDTETAFLLRRDESSIILWHDYGYSPETVRWPVLAGILDGCPPENRHELVHVSNTLLAMHRTAPIKSRRSRTPSTPSTLFTVDVTAQPWCVDGTA